MEKNIKVTSDVVCVKCFSLKKLICYSIQSPVLIDSPEFGAVVVLRTLLLKLFRPEDWEKVLTLEHHNDDRKNLPFWKEDESVANIIRDQWKLGDLFTEDEIHNVSQINFNKMAPLPWATIFSTA